jgi:hypothetical protein
LRSFATAAVETAAVRIANTHTDFLISNPPVS